MAGKHSETSSGIFETGFSYINVPGPALSPLTMGQLVDDAARKWGNSEYFYDVPMDTRLTFSQLKHEVDLLASGLLKMGLNKGDRIGIWGPNSYRWILTYLAAAKIGIIIVPLSTTYEAPELLYALNHLSVKCLVFAEPVKTRDFYTILTETLPDMKILNENDNDNSPIAIPKISSDLTPHLNTLIYMGKERLNGTFLWMEVQKLGQKEESDLEKMRRVADVVQFDDILCTPFTSGTTGRPKAAMISHFAHVNSLFRFGSRLCLTQQDRKCQTLPLFHMYGNLVATMSLCFGCSVVIPSPTFSPSSAITVAAQEKCTWLHGSPTMYFDMMNVLGFDQLDLSSVKGAVISSAVVSMTLLAKIQSNYGISKVTPGYGTTEGGHAALNRIDDPPELGFSCGYPQENTEFKIIDKSGRIVPIGQTGEICFRSFGVMHGYWEDEEKTREAIDSARWYHTGDAGYFLESGHFAIVGRFKDMLIRGGENIYPKEIEDFLYENLEIEEVHVFGLSDERLGEVVGAWIFPKPGVTMDTNQIKSFCEGKISRSKIPVYIKVLQSTNEFPRTAIGKAQKNVMRQQYEKELGLNQFDE